MKVTRWEEKLFNVLVDPIKEAIDERKVESKLNYYYQRLDTQDLVVAGRIGDVESNYQLLADLGMQALLSKGFGIPSFLCNKSFHTIGNLEKRTPGRYHR